MSVSINLVDNKSSEIARAEKIKKFRAISFGILFVTAFLSVIIFALDYRFSASYVKNQEAELLNELTPFADASAKIFILNTKLSDIDKILNSRSNHSEKVKTIASGNSGSVIVEEFLINESGITMVISATSLPPLDEYLNYLISLVNDEQLSSIFLNNLTADENGFKVELTII